MMQTDTDIYERLAAPFDETFKDTRGGFTFDYITGEQCVSRLNEVLGVWGWSFAIKEHGLNPDADEIWVLGSFSATIVDTTIHREQFGSQKIKRRNADGLILDIGFDLKGAATDALKKCAMSLGVGLYLSKKEPQHQPGPAHSNGSPPQSNVRAFSPAPKPNQQEAPPAWDQTWICEECGKTVTDTKFKNGDVMTAEALSGNGRRKHGRVLCMDHYRAANTLNQGQAAAGNRADFRGPPPPPFNEDELPF